METKMLVCNDCGCKFEAERCEDACKGDAPAGAAAEGQVDPGGRRLPGVQELQRDHCLRLAAKKVLPDRAPCW